MNKKKYTRLALAMSLFFIVVWFIMGTGTSLAWFTDTDDEVKNIFHFAEFEVMVEYRGEDGNWYNIESDSSIFDENALYEPGYTQVVYLRVTNLGTVPFDFKTAVSVTDYTVANNVFGQPFLLQNYLKFGLTPAVPTEAAMDALVADRTMAASYATMPLCNYSTDVAELAEKSTVYMALVVRMPEEVDNVANYREGDIPTVLLGLIVTATQKQ